MVGLSDETEDIPDEALTGATGDEVVLGLEVRWWEGTRDSHPIPEDVDTVGAGWG